ncbi:MAG: hypothetical protein ACK5RK_09175 [Betaproteobacteria bacterium]
MPLPAALVPVVAAGVFGACGLLAAAALGFLLGNFGAEAGVPRWLMIAVPGLFAMLFALIVYQGAATRVTTMGQSLSRALLVALLTWFAFSALATVVWCFPQNYAACLSSSLVVSGILGGGPLLIGALAAGCIVGTLILRGRQ